MTKNNGLTNGAKKMTNDDFGAGIRTVGKPKSASKFKQNMP